MPQKSRTPMSDFKCRETSVYTVKELFSAFERLRAAHSAEPYPGLDVRRQRLARLENAVRSSIDAFGEAISADFGHRSFHETLLGEIWVTLNHLKYVQRHLAIWMRPRRQGVHFAFLPGRARIVPQPMGVVGIISPWNYPAMLALVPLIGALSAGNRVILKPSEHTPRTAELLARVLDEHLGGDLICTAIGDVEMGRAVSALPLDHLLFTGSFAVGKQVAKAAAENLVPYTLELGGKCPALLHSSFPIERFAASIVQGKCFNAGQSCVAPDFLLVPRGAEESVTAAISKEVSLRYSHMVSNPDYSGVVGTARRLHFQAIIDDAVARGASRIDVNPASEAFGDTCKLPFTMLLDVPDDARAMQEELFGPVLPIVVYDDFDDAITYLQQAPRPLAIYYFDNNRDRIERVLRETSSGGATINDTLLHFICDALPRGGIGASGMGSYGGAKSFETFSHLKSVFYGSRWIQTGLFKPPYGPRFEKLLRFLGVKSQRT
jgi:coniferyl-aldehyde dehydrogenase